MFIGCKVGVAVGVKEGDGLGVRLGAGLWIEVSDADGDAKSGRGAEGAAGVPGEASAEVWLADRYISDGSACGVSAQAEIRRQTPARANQ
jgi:hypothetical protein